MPQGNSGTADLRLTLPDLLAAARLHHLAAMGSRRTLIIVTILAGVGFGVGYLIAVDGDEPLLIGAAGAASMVVYLYVLMLIARYVVMPFSVRRQFREQRNLHEDYAIAWDERCYTVTGQTTRSALPWGDYLKWRENDRVLLLYVSSGLYQVVPKQSLAVEVVAAIRAHLERTSVPKGGLLFG